MVMGKINPWIAINCLFIIKYIVLTYYYRAHTFLKSSSIAKENSQRFPMLLKLVDNILWGITLIPFIQHKPAPKIMLPNLQPSYIGILCNLNRKNFPTNGWSGKWFSSWHPRCCKNPSCKGELLFWWCSRRKIYLIVNVRSFWRNLVSKEFGLPIEGHGW